MEKVKNRAEMRIAASRIELGRRADLLQRAYMFTGNTDEVNSELGIFRSITPDELQQAAQQYLTRDESVVLHVLPH